jgi:anti-sigma B factor antagonist
VNERRPRIYVIVLEGEVDMSTSPDVRKTMIPIFQKNPDHVIIDLSGVDYMDSSGIATLIEGYQQSQQKGVRYTLAGMRPSVEAAFDLAHLKEIFEVVSAVDMLLEEGEKRSGHGGNRTQ